jgi:hypothetical protein
LRTRASPLSRAHSSCGRTSAIRTPFRPRSTSRLTTRRQNRGPSRRPGRSSTSRTGTSTPTGGVAFGFRCSPLGTHASSTPSGTSSSSSRSFATASSSWQPTPARPFLGANGITACPAISNTSSGSGGCLPGPCAACSRARWQPSRARAPVGRPSSAATSPTRTGSGDSPAADMTGAIIEGLRRFDSRAATAIVPTIGGTAQRAARAPVGPAK